ncbi:MAG: helix-turn-helix transcriptional regulator [Sarcina sp.]|nr:helix-turn-helix transcriptional regulator [Sarcina sp.]
MHYRERIRTLRKEQNLSQQEVAGILNIPQRTYSDYETGRVRIPVDRLILLARHYDCSVDFITGASNTRCPFPTM